MIYIPNYISNADGGVGATAGAVIGTALGGPVGTAIGSALGGVVENLFSAGKSVWSSADGDTKRKLVSTIVYDAIWNNKISLMDGTTKIYHYIYDKLNSNGQFEGRPGTYDQFINANKWIHVPVFKYHGMNGFVAPAKWEIIDQNLFDNVKNWVTKGVGTPPPPDADIMVDNSQQQPPVDYSKAPAKPGSKETAKTEEEKKAANKKLLLYGGIGLGVLLLIVVLIFVLKKKRRK